MKKQTTSNIVMSPETKVTFPPLHKSQAIVHDDPHRFKVLVAGRRFGKSWLALREALDRAINLGMLVWFVSPTYNNVLTHWRTAKMMVGQLYTYKNEQYKYMEFYIGDRRGSIAFKSGDRPNNLLGEGLDYLVLDEAAYQSEDLWYRVLRPSLSDKQGGALLISTPNGVSNYFYRLYLAGQDIEEPEWASWRFPSVNNPKMTKSEVAAAKRDLPDLRFKQEYLAEFVSDAGGVFRNLENVTLAHTLSEPTVGKHYVAGVDWGRKNDFTVVSIFDSAGEQVHIERFSEIGYAVQRQRIVALNEKWAFKDIYAESNSMGMPNIEALQAEGLPITPIYMTNVMKTLLVERLALNIERGFIKLISPEENIGEMQLGELQSYTLHRTRGGLQVAYDAPRGMHDDIVVATMLANMGLTPPIRKELKIAPNPFYGGKQEKHYEDINYERA